MSLVEDFGGAVTRSKELTRRPNDEELLDLYALVKQATEGDNQQLRPGGFDFKAIAKQAAKIGKTTDQAMEEYISLVDNLYQQYH